MFCKLLATVEGHAPSEPRRKIFHAPFRRPHGDVRLHAVDATNTSITTFSLDQGEQCATAALSHDGFTFPVTVASSSIDHVGAPVDADTIGQFSPFFRRSTTATQ